MDVTSKIVDLTRKQAALEEKMSTLDCTEQIGRERKVLLRQHCDVKIRLKNLRYMMKEKTQANEFLSQSQKQKDNGKIQMMKKIDVKESEMIQDATETVEEVPDPENEVDVSDCSLDETFYTACESVASDIALDFDDVMDEEEEVRESNQMRAIVAPQPQETRLAEEEESKKCWLGKEESELEVRIGQWIQRNKSSIIQQVRLKLAEEQAMSSSSVAGKGQGERSGFILIVSIASLLQMRTEPNTLL